MYNINYHTGAGDESGFETIDDAKVAAVEGATYTQQDITIENENGDEVARLPWCGVEADEDEDDEVEVSFGSFGYYAQWQDK